MNFQLTIIPAMENCRKETGMEFKTKVELEAAAKACADLLLFLAALPIIEVDIYIRISNNQLSDFVRRGQLDRTLICMAVS